MEGNCHYILLKYLHFCSNNWFWIVAEHFCYIIFFNRVIRLIALSYLQFEAIRHKFHCKCPVKKFLVTGRKGLLQRSLSRKLCEQLTKGNKVCLVDPWKPWETWSIHNVTYNEGQQPNTNKPKKKNKLIKEIFILTTRIELWHSSKRAAWARLLIMRSPTAQINSSGVKWLLVCSVWFLGSTERRRLHNL